MTASSKHRVRAEYDTIAADYERRWGRYTAASVRETLRRAPIVERDRVLDVGCGTGALLHELRGCVPSVRLMGVDMSVGMLEAARRRTIPAAAGDAESLPLRNASFEVVVSSSSFHFWPDRLRALAEIRRVLVPGGRVVITDWCDDFVACRLCDLYLRWRDPAHRPALSRAGCAELLERAGFELLSLDAYRISWVWGLMTAVAVPRERRPEASAPAGASTF